MLMKEKIKEVTKAYQKYNMENREEISKAILKEVRNKVENVREEIELMEKIEPVRYAEIMSMIEQKIEEPIKYKSQVNIVKREDGFASATYQTSIGIIVVEESNPISVILCLLESIITRNGIVISDLEYKEKDIKHLMLEIIQLSLKEYGQDEKLVDIIPYEECYNEGFDLIVNQTVKTRKENEKKIYLYEEDSGFQNEVMAEKERLEKQGCEVEVIRGEMEDVIEKINSKKGEKAAIYTKDRKKGYEFINLIHRDNVFMNATLLNAKKVESSDNVFYMWKHMMYELY